MPFSVRAPRAVPARALDAAQRERLVEQLCSERFLDRSPAEVVYTLLEEGQYLASERTMYRVLAARGEVRERRNQRTHPQHTRPELVATAPNAVWSWDITRLRTAAKWSYFYLYVLLDLFSRYVVGWLLARQDRARRWRRYSSPRAWPSTRWSPENSCCTCCTPTAAAPMTSKTLAQLLADLEVTRSFTRPYTSNDSPFSESQFRTLKYPPSYPGRFATLDQALAWTRGFFHWYHHEHHHSGIAFLTPANVYYGHAEAVLARRHQTLLAAYAEHPERFPNGPPPVCRQAGDACCYRQPPTSIHH